MEHGKFRKIIVMIYFLAVNMLMYYNLETVLRLQVFFSYRHVLAFVLTISGFLYILVKPDLGRLSVSAKSSLVFCAPTIAALVVSMIIWVINMTPLPIIFRGLSYYLIFINMITSSFAAGVMLYVFGEKGIWYNLACIVTVNLFILIQIISEEGVGPFFTEFSTLLRTFAGETGPVIARAELHELAFCLGAYIVYMLFRPQPKKVWFWVLAVLTVFCFLTALKRIAVVSIAVVTILGVLLKLANRISEKLCSLLLHIMEFGLILFLVLYIGMIHGDGFTLLEDIGIDTMGRADAFSTVHDLYEFSPTFLGYGIGFVSYQINEVFNEAFHSVHNDFLQHYVDLGFWGYIVWLICQTAVRTVYFRKRSGMETSILAFLMCAYLLLVSLTDNTMSYPLVNTVIALLVAGDGFDKVVNREDQRIISYLDHRDSAVMADDDWEEL